jgi:DNA-binding LacI/PurR family transcriptional regulator
MTSTLKRRVTLEDVASKARVSRATVSRVVRQVPGVDSDIVERVNKAISQMGYRTNVAARALAGGKTQNVAIIFRENFSDLFMNGYWGQILEGIHSVLRESDLQMTFLINHGEYAKDLPQYLLNNHVDGAVFLGTAKSDKLPALLHKSDIPLVVLGEPHQANRLSKVTGDDHAAGEVAARTLLNSGCKNIGMIVGNEDIASSEDRSEGFIDSLQKLGYKIKNSAIESGNFTQRGGYEAVGKILKRYPELDGVFILSDMMAIGALENLNRLNKKVPDEISVIGCDNSPAGELSNPKLTTIDYNPFEAGRSTGELLIDLMRGGHVKSLIFPPKLIQRESTKK